MSPMDAWESALLRKCMKHGVVYATIPIEAGEVEVAEEKDETADTNEEEEKEVDGDGDGEAKDDATAAAGDIAAADAGYSGSGINFIKHLQ